MDNPSKTKIVLTMLIILLLWRIIDQNILLVAGICFVGYSLYQNKETFNKDGKKFVDLGEPRYGLRGDLLDTYPVGYPKPPDYHCVDKCK